MARQKPDETPAAFLRRMGWAEPGTLLSAAPIYRGGNQIENGIQFLISAVGEGRVLGRSRVIPLPSENQAGNSSFSAEHMVTFNMREWQLADPQHPREEQNP